MEITILSTLNYNLINVSTYEFVKTFYFDFIHNNKNSIESSSKAKYMECLENNAIFLSKLMLHDENFYEFKYIVILNNRSSSKAVAALTCAFDILRMHSKTPHKEAENLVKRWLRFLLKEINVDEKELAKLYDNLREKYNQFSSIDWINKNLLLFHQLQYC